MSKRFEFKNKCSNPEVVTIDQIKNGQFYIEYSAYREFMQGVSYLGFYKKMCSVFAIFFDPDGSENDTIVEISTCKNSYVILDIEETHTFVVKT